MRPEELKVLVAPDSFKESLNTTEVAKYIVKGWKKAYPTSQLITCPISDGGEGFLDAVSMSLNMQYLSTTVADLTGKKRKIRYGWLPKQKVAIIETASVVGLHLVPPENRTPEKFTSYGVGEVILNAIQKGAKQVVLGLGGSGVNDGGAGIAQALGYQLLNFDGKPIGRGPLDLQNLACIKSSIYGEQIKNTAIIIASDVKNPYYGSHGATFVYGPQKGLRKELCPIVDRALKHFACIIKRDMKIDVQKQPGSGSAGGMGGALFAFAFGKFIPGFQWIAQASNLSEKVASVDLVITGEGQLDYQSFSGKVVGEMIHLAKLHDKPVIILVGTLGKGWEICLSKGNVIVFPISAGETSKEELLKNTSINLQRTSQQIAKLFHYNHKTGIRRAD
ncbi:MAG TPA: glycerate kinase [Candidatus Hydrogenedens sp.]|nr:glycerate kinase [Candidatus Hydrogenedens sp.]HOL19106.1 glycerate kinase [Candidatus Hydrogenedens sp.]HPP58076.1 glycerate kinase [Candidatus Hydrogenedens sp.]